jgi:hypothetical protein
MKCFVAEKKSPVYVFFNTKSSSETIEHIKADPREYLHTAEVLRDSSGRRPPFLYAYVSAYDGDSCVLGGNGIIVGRNDSLDILGPFAELYNVASDATVLSMTGLLP